ncbi:hypothetical protein PWT90_02558 [Aphanocladium album]|nr:hypothetical protein PWT90_02558 [Aphanocladium album]
MPPIALDQSHAVQTSTSLPSEKSSDASYWWQTSGRDLARMLEEAEYPEQVRKQFLDFYRTVLCPQLGTKPRHDSKVACMSWDGTPFEYSFELRGSTKKQKVRFSIDLTQLRPTDPAFPLNINSTQTVVDILAKRTPGFDDAWYKSIKSSFVHSDLSSADQHALVAKTGYYTQVGLGFDIASKPSADDSLPVLGKVYFPPCFAAAQQGITRWDAVQNAIRALPAVDQVPNIIKSMELIDDFVTTNSDEYRHGPRFLATDFVSPDKSRLKVYFRQPFQDFESIWNFYTLGGRIPGLDEDKEMVRDLFAMAGNTTGQVQTGDESKPHYTTVAQKMTAIYFSLSPNNPLPAPKILFYPKNIAENDEIITRGVDQWLHKYNWYDGGKSMEQRTQNVFTHRRLSERTGICSFMGIGRKEDPTKRDLSLQFYVTPELYTTPRF